MSLCHEALTRFEARTPVLHLATLALPSYRRLGARVMGLADPLARASWEKDTRCRQFYAPIPSISLKARCRFCAGNGILQQSRWGYFAGCLCVIKYLHVIWTKYERSCFFLFSSPQIMFCCTSLDTVCTGLPEEFHDEKGADALSRPLKIYQFIPHNRRDTLVIVLRCMGSLVG